MQSSRRRFLQATGGVLAALRLGLARELSCDVAVIGGGVGGCAAALAAARKEVEFTEFVDRITRS